MMLRLAWHQHWHTKKSDCCSAVLYEAILFGISWPSDRWVDRILGFVTRASLIETSHFVGAHAWYRLTYYNGHRRVPSKFHDIWKMCTQHSVSYHDDLFSLLNQFKENSKTKTMAKVKKSLHISILTVLELHSESDGIQQAVASQWTNWNHFSKTRIDNYSKARKDWSLNTWIW